MRFEYVQDFDTLRDTVRRISGVPVLGVDTEAAGYHRYHDTISLLQISTREENFLIDPISIRDLSPLAELFADSSVEKIFHDADFDLRILHRDASLEIRGLFDTQVAAAFAGEKQLGLGAVVEKFLGISLPKAYQRADWAERPLTAGMMEYAATDTVHLPPLRDRLTEELTRLGRMEWATEEFARRQTTRWTETEDSSEAFMRMKGARDLTPRGLAILRELFEWREAIGRQRDQATFRIISNQTLLELALKAPTDLVALGEVRGIPGGILERQGRELIAAIGRGLAVEEGNLPRFPPSKRWDRDPVVEERGERLRQARNLVAESLGLDPGFVISRALLDEIARRNPADLAELGEIPDVRRWQVEALGAQLIAQLRR